MGLRRNISTSEGTCPDGCGLEASGPLLDRGQELRDRAGQPLRFTSIVRCETYNEKIGGALDSPHKLSGEPGPYGAFDIATTNPRDRWEWTLHALALGFNHIEIADKHVHFGFVPDTHRLKNYLNWGRSK